MIKNLIELIKYREFLKNLVLKDLKVRYKRSVLGFFWTMLNPLLMMIILTIVFSTIMRFDVKNFSIFLLCGILPWNFFAQAVSMSTMSIIGNAGLIKKVYIPKVIFPISSVTSNLVNFSLALIPLFLLFPVMSADLKITALMLPVSMIIVYFFTVGVALIFATMNVFFRDVSHIIDVIFQGWFYITPIIYPIKLIPEKYLIFFKINPMYYIINCFRAPLYDGVMPLGSDLAIASASAFIVFLFGWWIFNKFENNFIHYI